MSEITSGFISMQKTDVLKIDPHSLVSIERDGDNLIITDKNGQKYLINKFFVGEDNTLLFEFEGTQYTAKIADGGKGIELVFNEVTGEPAAGKELSDTALGLSSGEWFSVALGAGLIGGGIGLASSGSGGGSSRKKSGGDTENPSHEREIVEKTLISQSDAIHKAITETQNTISKLTDTVKDLLEKYSKDNFEDAQGLFKDATTGLALIEQMKSELAKLIEYGEKIGVSKDVLNGAKDALNTDISSLNEQLENLAFLLKKIETDNNIDDTGSDIDDLPDNPTPEQLAKAKAKLDKTAQTVEELAKAAEARAKAAEKAAEKALKTGNQADIDDARAKLDDARDAVKMAEESKAKLDELINKAAGKGVDTKDAQLDADSAQDHLDSAGNALDHAGKILSDLNNDISKDLDNTEKAIDDLPDNASDKEKAKVKQQLDDTAKKVDKLAEQADKLAEDAKKAAEKARESGSDKDLADAEAKLEKAKEALKDADTAKARLDDLIAKAGEKGVDTSDAKKEAESAQDHLDKAHDNLDRTESIIDEVKANKDLDGTDPDGEDLAKVKAQLDKAAESVSKQAQSAEKLAKAAEAAAEKARASGDKADLKYAKELLAEARDALHKAQDSKAKLDDLIGKAAKNGVDTKDAQHDADIAQDHLNNAGKNLDNAGKIISGIQSDIDNKIDDTGKAIDDLDDKSTDKEKAEVKEKLDDTAKAVDKLAEEAEKLAEDAKKAAEKARETGSDKDLADAEEKLEKAKDALKDAEDAKSKLDDLISKAEDKGVDTSDAKKEAESAQDHLDKAHDNIDSGETIVDEVKAKKDLEEIDPDDKDSAKVKAQLDKAAESVSKQAQSAEKLAKAAEAAAEKARASGDKADLKYAKELLAEARDAVNKAQDSKAKLDDLIGKAAKNGVDIKDAQHDADIAQDHLNNAGKNLDNAGKIISGIQSDIDNKIDDTGKAIDDLDDKSTDKEKAEVKEKLDDTAKAVDKLAEEAEKLAEDAKKAAEKARETGSDKDLADAEEKLEKAKDALKDAEDAKSKLDDLISKAEDKGVDTSDAKKEAESAQEHLDNAKDNIDSSESIVDEVKAKKDLDDTDVDNKDLDKVKSQLEKAAESVSKQAQSAEKLAKAAEAAAEKARDSGDENDLAKAEAKLKEAKDVLKKAHDAKSQLDDLIGKAAAKGVDTKDAQHDADIAKQHLDGADSALNNAGKIIDELKNLSDIDKEIDDTGKAIDDLDDKSTEKEKAEVKEKLDTTAKHVDQLAQEAERLADKAKETAEKALNSGSKTDLANAEKALEKAQDALNKATDAKEKLDDLISKAKGKGVDTTDAQKEAHSAEDHLDNAQSLLDDTTRLIDEIKAKNDLDDTDTDIGKLPDNPSEKELAQAKAKLDKAAESVLKQAENAKVLAKIAQTDAEEAVDNGTKADLAKAQARLEEATAAVKRAEDAKAKLDELISKAAAKGVNTKDAQADADLAQEHLQDARDALADAANTLKELLKDVDGAIDDADTAIDDLPKNPTDEQKEQVKDKVDFASKLVDNLANEAETLAKDAKSAADKARKSGSKADLADAEAKQAVAKDTLKKAEDAKAKLDKLIEKAAGKGIDTHDAAKDASSADQHIDSAQKTIAATDKVLADIHDDNDSKDPLDKAEDIIKDLDGNSTPEEKAKAKEVLDAASGHVVTLADNAKTLAAEAKTAAQKAQSSHDIKDLNHATALLKEAKAAFDAAGTAKAKLDKIIKDAAAKGVDTKDASADSETAKGYLDDAQQDMTAAKGILDNMPTDMTDPALDDADKAIDDATKNPSEENSAKAKESLDLAAGLVAKQAKEAETVAKQAKSLADKAKISGKPDDIKAAEEAIKAAAEVVAKAEKSKAQLDKLIGKAKAADIDVADSKELADEAAGYLTGANNALKDANQILEDLSNQEGDPALIAEVHDALVKLNDEIQIAQNKGMSANSKIDKLVGETSPAEKGIKDAKAALAEFDKAIKSAEDADLKVKAALDKAAKGGVGAKVIAGLTETEQELLSTLNDQKKLADMLHKQIQEIESNAALDELHKALDDLDPKKPETVEKFNKALKNAIDKNNELVQELSEKAQKALDTALKLAEMNPDSAEYKQTLEEAKLLVSSAEDLYALANSNTQDLKNVVEKAIGKGLDPNKNPEFKEYIANIKYFENEINKAGANIAKAKNAIPDEKLPDFEGDDISKLVDHLEDQIKAGDADGINKTLLDVDSVLYAQLNTVNKAIDKATRAFEKAQKDPTTANVKAFDKAVIDAQNTINKAELNISKLHDTLVKAGQIDGVDADSLAHALKSTEKADAAIDQAQKDLDALTLNPIDMEGLEEKANDAKDAVDEVAKNPTPDNIENALAKLGIFKSALDTTLKNAKALSDDALMAAKQAAKTPTAENILLAEKKLAKAIEAQEQLKEAKALYDDVHSHIEKTIPGKGLQDALLKTFEGMDSQFEQTQKTVKAQNDESEALIAYAKEHQLSEEDIVNAYNDAKSALSDAEAKVREAVEKAAKAKESGVISKENTTEIKESVILAQRSLDEAKNAINNAGNKGVPDYLMDQLGKYYNSLDNKLDYPKGVLQEIDAYSRWSLSVELLNTSTDYYKKAEELLKKDPDAVIKDPSEFLAIVSEANAYLAEGKERATKAKALGIDKESETFVNTAAYKANETKTKLMNDFLGKLGEKAFADLDVVMNQLQDAVYNAHINLDHSTLNNHAVFEEQYKSAIRSLNDAKMLLEDYKEKGVSEAKLSYYNYQVEQYSKEVEGFSKAWNSITELTELTNLVYQESKALGSILNTSDKYDAVQKVGEDLGKAYQLVEQSIINGAPLEMIQANLNKLTATVNNLSAEDPIIAAQVLIDNVVSESKNIENLLKAAQTKEQKDLVYNSLYSQLLAANKVMNDAKLSGTISKTQLAELQQDYNKALSDLKAFDPNSSTGDKTQKPNTGLDPMTISVSDDGYVHIEGKKLVDGAVFTLGGKDLPWYSAWLGNIAGNVDKVFGSGTVHTRTDGTKYVDIFVDKETAYNIKHSDSLSYLYGYQQEQGKDQSDVGSGFQVGKSAVPTSVEAYITDDHTVMVTGNGLKAGDTFTLYKVTFGLLGAKSYEAVGTGHVSLHNGKFVGVMTEYKPGHSWDTVKNMGVNDDLSITRKGVGENESAKSEVFGKKESPAEMHSGLTGKYADIVTKDVTAWVDSKKNLYLKSQKFEVGQQIKVYDYYDSKTVLGYGTVQMIGGQKVVKIEGITTDKYPDLKWILAEIAYPGGQWDFIQSDAFILGKNWLSVQGNVNSNTQEPPKDNDVNDGINFDDIDIEPSVPAGKTAGGSDKGDAPADSDKDDVKDDVKDGETGEKESTGDTEQGSGSDSDNGSTLTPDAPEDATENETAERDGEQEPQEETNADQTENDEQPVTDGQPEYDAEADFLSDDADFSALLEAGNTSAAEADDIDTTTDGNAELPVLEELLADSADSTINVDNVAPEAADTEHQMQQTLVTNDNTADSSHETHQVTTLITEDDMGITHNI